MPPEPWPTQPTLPSQSTQLLPAGAVPDNLSVAQQCQFFSALVLKALDKTLDHFIAPAKKKPHFTVKEAMDGEKKEITLYGHKPGLGKFGPAFLITHMAFNRWDLNKRALYTGIASSPIMSSTKFSRPLYATLGKDGINLESLVNHTDFNKTMSDFIAGIVKECAPYYSQNHDDIYKLKEIIAPLVDEAAREMFFLPQETLEWEKRRSGNSLSGPASVIKGTLPAPADTTPAFERDLRALAEAIKNSMDRTIEDLGKVTGFRRPTFQLSYDMKGTSKTIEVAIKSRGSYLPIGRTDFTFNVTFDTTAALFYSSKGLLKSRYDSGHSGYMYVPFQKPDQKIADTINDEITEALAAQISYIFLNHKNFQPLLHAGNVEETKALPAIIRKNLEQALQTAFDTTRAPPEPVTPVFQRQNSETAPSPAATNNVSLHSPVAGNNDFERDLRALASAVKQSIDRAIEDLVTPTEKRPRVKTKVSFEGTHAAVEINTRYYRFLPLYQDTFSISFTTRQGAQYINSVEREIPHDGGTCNGLLGIPLNPEDLRIASYLDERVIEDITAQIYEGLKENHEYLLEGKIDQSARLPQTIKEHLAHALAATFGGELAPSAHKPLEIASFNKDAADEQFRSELSALMTAGRADHYLLQTFGMAAGSKAGEDASVIAEWQIGRTLRLPATLDKIRHLSRTLETFAQYDVQSRARNAGELMSQMRSLQKTAGKDMQALAVEAKSIHGAKTIMREHEELLQKYVQGFHHRKSFLAETFGDASVEKRENALLTNLAAAQIHTSNQESIHERLTLSMMEQISDFSTNMAFLARSMQEIVTETTLQSLVREGQVIGDMSAGTLEAAGLQQTDIKRYSGFSHEDLEQSISGKINALHAQLVPITLAADHIEYDLITAEAREIKLLPTPESFQPDEPEA